MAPKKMVQQKNGNVEADTPSANEGHKNNAEKVTKKNKKTGKVKRITKSHRAGLMFPVGRIRRLLKDGRYAERISIGGAVYMAGVLEYLAAELVEIAGDVSRATKRSRIIPRHILLAVKQDDEFNALLKDVIISRGGVEVHIEPALLPKRTTAIATDHNSDDGPQ